MSNIATELPLEECLIHPDGQWLVDIAEELLNVSLALAVLYYLPYIAVLFVTLLTFRYCPTQRSKVLIIPATIWAGIWLISNAPLVLLIPCYIETRKTSSSFFRAVGRHL